MANDTVTSPRAPAGHRLVIVVEFIGDRRFDGSCELAELVPAAIDGDLSMRILESRWEAVSGAQLALLALAHGSDPEFVGVDQDGWLIESQGDSSDRPPLGEIHDCGGLDVVCELLRQRGCAILDREAVSAALTGNRGPLYHDGHDLDELGQSWAQRGELWLSGIERELISLSAITPPIWPGSAPGPGQTNRAPAD
jgi:hypothetical protein